jgi:Na+-transporting NADH:ubiquinone oxidoreductase subunit NqrC
MDGYNQNLNNNPQDNLPPQVETPPDYSALPKNKNNHLWDIILIVVLVVLLASNIFYGAKYFSVQSRINMLNVRNASNAKIINFENLFVSKVLKSQGEISYQDRLDLENAVVATKDNDIISQWHNFLASKSETEAQQDVLTLLITFTSKIK